MGFFTEMSQGLGAYSRAHKAIVQYRLGKYLILPGLISLGYGIVFLLLVIYLGGNFDASEVSWMEWSGAVGTWIVRVMFWIFMMWLFYATYKYVIMTFLSPLLSGLSENVERKMRGREAEKMTFNDYVSDVVRALRLSVRNLIREIFLGFAVSLVPVVGFILVFLVSSFYIGFGFMDYTLERKRLSLKESVRFVNRRRGLAIGIGIPANLALLVPIIGWWVAPTYATVASTLEIMDELEEMRHPQR